MILIKGGIKEKTQNTKTTAPRDNRKIRRASGRKMERAEGNGFSDTTSNFVLGETIAARQYFSPPFLLVRSIPLATEYTRRRGRKPSRKESWYFLVFCLLPRDALTLADLAFMHRGLRGSAGFFVAVSLEVMIPSGPASEQLEHYSCVYVCIMAFQASRLIVPASNQHISAARLCRARASSIRPSPFIPISSVVLPSLFRSASRSRTLRSSH